MSNIISIPKTQHGDEIYRVLSVVRLFEMFRSRQNVLVRPKLWDDPFENYVLKSIAMTAKGQTVTFRSQASLYGQCWTLERETDAMWRIYSSDKMGVRVRTTIKKLYDSLRNQIPIGEQKSAFIGKVRYQTQKSMVEQIKDRTQMRALLDSDPVGVVSTLLMKRQEFRHEREVRLIYFNHLSDTGDLFRYGMEPNDLIDEIVFDPRMNDELVHVFLTHLTKIGFRGRVKKSPLYQLPDLRVSI